MVAAASLAEELSLGSVDPVLLSSGRHEVIRLSPLPIVVRARRADAAGAAAELARELRIGGHLAAAGAPAVRPAEGVAAGPHLRHGQAMSLWRHEPHRAAAGGEDARSAARALRRVHAAVASFDGPLPRLEDRIAECGDLLATPARTPRLPEVDRIFLIQLHARLTAELARRRYPPVPLHGDAHLGNALMLADGSAIWADLDAACIGPREWDVASLPDAAWPEFEAIDQALLACLAAIRSLCVAAWCWADFDRGATIAEAALDHLTTLRDRFGDGANTIMLS